MADRDSKEEETVAAGTEDHEAAAGGAGEEEDTGAQVAPIVRLEEIAVSTGEENEDPLLDMKAKLYRFDHEGKQWKERGVGQVKILRHNDTKKVRVLMRQNKTLKICANHYLIGNMTLQEHAGSDKSWVWYAMDFSDGEVKNELLCIRLGSVENAQRFKEVFVEVTESQHEHSEESNTNASNAADLLENLSVNELSSKPEKDTSATAAVNAEEPVKTEPVNAEEPVKAEAK